MQRERKLRAIRQRLGEHEFVKGDEFIFFCPGKGVHPKKPKLSVNVVTDRFHCWVCDWGGENLLPLMKKGSPEREEYFREIHESRGIKTEEPAKQYDPVVLPVEFKSLSTPSKSPYYRAAMEYLSARGIAFDDILLWKMGYCEDGDYKHRIIIPSFDEYGELNFFTGRTYYPGPPNYKQGNFCKDIITNDYLIDWENPVILTEGAFDAIQAGENAIPLQGSILREGSQLFRKIVSKGVDTYFALDTDAFKKQLTIIKLFVSYGVNCYYVNLFGKKDVGSMTKEEFQDAKKQARRVRSDTDLLKIRINA